MNTGFFIEYAKLTLHYFKYIRNGSSRKTTIFSTS